MHNQLHTLFVVINVGNMMYWEWSILGLQIEVFWVVMPCNVVGYQRFGNPCCLRLHPEEGGSMDLWNVDILPQYYTASQSIRTLFESSPPRKPQMS